MNLGRALLPSLVLLLNPFSAAGAITTTAASDSKNDVAFDPGFVKDREIKHDLPQKIPQNDDDDDDNEDDNDNVNGKQQQRNRHREKCTLSWDHGRPIDTRDFHDGYGVAGIFHNVSKSGGCSSPNDVCVLMPIDGAHHSIEEEQEQETNLDDEEMYAPSALSSVGNHRNLQGYCVPRSFVDVERERTHHHHHHHLNLRASKSSSSSSSSSSLSIVNVHRRGSDTIDRPDGVSCEEYCASNGGTIPVPDDALDDSVEFLNFISDKLESGAIINCIDTSDVKNMYRTFKSRSTFNERLDCWNVRQVTDMYEIFDNANDFNNDIDGWDVGSVLNMKWMFYAATKFNQCLGTWATKNKEDNLDVSYMFSDSGCPNQDNRGTPDPDNGPWCQHEGADPFCSAPSSMPSSMPSSPPSTSVQPSNEPSDVPSTSVQPSNEVSDVPSTSVQPSNAPSNVPSTSVQPSNKPSNVPTRKQTRKTTQEPTREPTRLRRPSFGCSDNPDFEFVFINKAGKETVKGDCEFVAKKRKKRCRQKIFGNKVKKECPVTCRLRKSKC